MAAAAGISVMTALVACLGCGRDTKVRFNGQPYHFGCVPAGQLQAASAPALKLRFLEDLHETWAPKKKTAGRLRGPFWVPPLPGITDAVEVSGGSWQREGAGCDLPMVVLDRTAAFLSAAASVDVTHGCLVHNPGETTYQGLPGFYKVMWHPWAEENMPHPLGSWDWRTTREHERWVPHTRASLLQRLADAGRYPDGFITDAYTCAVVDGKPDRTDLKNWAHHVRKTREAVIDRYGRDSEEYAAVKTNFSQAVTMMTGKWTAGSGRSFHPSCRVRRPDWGMAIADLSDVTMWMRCDQARQIVTDLRRPHLAPVAIRNVDELVIPAEALPILEEHMRPGGRDLIDPKGIKLGTFKVKTAA
jgi:hypothetical protein